MPRMPTTLPTFCTRGTAIEIILQQTSIVAIIDKTMFATDICDSIYTS